MKGLLTFVGKYIKIITWKIIKNLDPYLNLNFTIFPIWKRFFYECGVLTWSIFKFKFYEISNLKEVFYECGVLSVQLLKYLLLSSLSSLSLSLFSLSLSLSLSLSIYLHTHTHTHKLFFSFSHKCTHTNYPSLSPNLSLYYTHTHTRTHTNTHTHTHTHTHKHTLFLYKLVFLNNAGEFYILRFPMPYVRRQMVRVE